MPLPVAPIAAVVVRYGVVALAAYAVARRTAPAHFDQRGENAMDDTNEGLSLRRDPGQANATYRFKRDIRLGTNGPGISIDMTALGRLSFKRI
jgi:hypothetical protein